MNKFFLLLIFLVSLNNFSAHKPKVKVENFGNIKTFFISEFNFGAKTIASEELKMRIIGKLSKEISEKLGYKDTIIIERKTFLSYNKSNFYMLENDNSNYKLAVLDDGVVLKSNGKGLAIRIVSDKVDVIDVLKLVEYTIQNRLKINKSLVLRPYFHNEDEQIEVFANTEEFISKIVNQNSNLVDEIIKQEVILEEDTETIISWNKNEFVFKMNLEKFKPDNFYRDLLKNQFKIQDFKYFIKSDIYNFFLVFTTDQSFSFFDGHEENKILDVHIQKENTFYPFRISIEKMINKIVIYSRDYFYIYDIKKKLLQKIE
ncbi:hypothetical protein NZ698_17395 [Chryseobacterium sp. PBS4-4]|uniref:DUF3857 domain-containing protein n=1 Tax=Chryseobacterium edaphi TaxID=2976532 RepID=A0ABT2W9S0_9FLAO|nr:hypothetical protein [Chryseobacterium edaphi]MCU7618955.1 hypothetical protein [Chryseobacterium edaphi]